MGQSPDSSSYNETGDGLPFFQGNADFGLIHPTVRVWCNAPTKIAYPGDILISVRAPIGALNIADKECCIGRGLAALTVNESLCSRKYIWYAIANKVDELNSKGTGSTFKAISKNVLAETEIPLPLLDKQYHIAAVLDKISALISLRKQQLAKLDELVKARFVEMFGDLIANPMEWKFQKLSSLCDVRDGTHDSPEYVGEGYPLLTSKNFTSGIIDFTDCNLISEEDFEQINRRSKVDYGDIIMPMIGTIGHPVIVNTNRPFAIKNVALIKFGAEKISNIFVRQILDSDYFLNTTKDINRGGTQKFIALGDIRNIPIPLVPSVLQKQFAEYSQKVDRQKLTIQQSLDKLELLKKLLMQEYFG